MQDELVLLARARRFDTEALTQIHQAFYDPIFRYISFRVPDAATAEDLTSDVFLRLLTALHEHTAPQRTLRGWLYAVASRAVSDYYRKERQARTVELNETLASGDISPGQIVEMNITHAALREAMDDLTEEQQNVLALRYGWEMSIREVADLLGKTEGAVKQLQARGIAALSRRMKAGRA